MTYSATRARITSRKRKNHGWENPDRVIGPSNGNVIADPSLLVTVQDAVRESLAPRQGTAAAGFDETDHVADPVSIGSKRQQRRPAAAQRAGHVGAMGSGGLGEVVAQLLVDGEFAGAPGLGVLQDDV